MDLVCQCFGEHLCIYNHNEYWSVVFFCCNMFVRFWYQGNSGHMEWVENYSLLTIFWKNFWRLGVNSSLNNWWNSPVKSSGSEIYFVESFWLLIQSISLLTFRFSVSAWVRFSTCVFLGICPYLGYPICWHKIVHIIPF